MKNEGHFKVEIMLVAARSPHFHLLDPALMKSTLAASGKPARLLKLVNRDSEMQPCGLLICCSRLQRGPNAGVGWITGL